MESSSGELYGWAAALLSCFAFGTFGVPMKSDAANRADIDPLVFQSYKTIAVLLTSPLVPLFFGWQYLVFTPWGIVSGIFWVPAGVAAVYAVRSPAGLAASQGTWSSIIVLVSFFWGSVIFREAVRSVWGACAGIGLMVTGLWGMSYISSWEEFDSADAGASGSIEAGRIDLNSTGAPASGKRHQKGYEGIGREEESENDQNGSMTSFDAIHDNDEELSPRQIHGTVEMSPIALPGSVNRVTTMPGSVGGTIREFNNSRRQLGLASAVFNGVWGGSIMVPMHYAPETASGLGYVISFAAGATIVTLFLWLCRLCYHLTRVQPRCSIGAALRSLPSFHLSEMILPGGIAGVLWSLGNVCSMVSVENLGEGVGYSVPQASMLVSGLWGIFWFQEVVGAASRVKWFLAALITIVGILVLGHEHIRER